MTTTIQDRLAYLRKLPFPEWAEDDMLAEWQSELAETEGFVAGLATSAIAGGSPDTSMVGHHMHKLREAFDAVVNVPEEDREIYAHCAQYMAALEDLARSLNAD